MNGPKKLSIIALALWDWASGGLPLSRPSILCWASSSLPLLRRTWVKPNHINLRHKTSMWIVLKLLRPGTATLLSQELSSYNITLAGICETHWSGSGESFVGDYCLIWIGPRRPVGASAAWNWPCPSMPQVTHQIEPVERPPAVCLFSPQTREAVGVA